MKDTKEETEKMKKQKILLRCVIIIIIIIIYYYYYNSEEKGQVSNQERRKKHSIKTAPPIFHALESLFLPSTFDVSFTIKLKKRSLFLILIKNQIFVIKLKIHFKH